MGNKAWNIQKFMKRKRSEDDWLGFWIEMALFGFILLELASVCHILLDFQFEVWAKNKKKTTRHSLSARNVRTMANILNDHF